MSSPSQPLFLVTGAAGFIGSHVVKALLAQGKRVRATDIVAMSPAEENSGDFIQGDLRDRSFVFRICSGVHSVLHFAANMGGMGTIHAANDGVIYADNSVMVQNVLLASLESGVRRFLYSSSACVYPHGLQDDLSKDIALSEEDAWKLSPPQAQGLYGQEKLVSELYLQNFSDQLELRIVRFHNIFGPGGSFDNGREKAPAALIRKALAIKLSGPGSDTELPELEIWGDGLQRRSFLYIDDAVDAVLRLLESKCSEPINVGSDRSVSIKWLAEIALTCAGVSLADVVLQYKLGHPVGVASRNAHLGRVEKELSGWRPKISLEDGMAQTAMWMEKAMKLRLSSIASVGERARILQGWKQSTVIQLSPKPIKFALLLPITSRGSVDDDPHTCLRNLSVFARSLIYTTRDDIASLDVHFQIKIYIVIDHDDDYLLGRGGEFNKATKVLSEHGLCDTQTLIANYPRGHVCNLWRDAATRAYQDDCDYYVLMGDDIELHDPGWMNQIHREFRRFSEDYNVPLGFGCVAFTDSTFPGMPTFPVVHKMHMMMFEGEVVPRAFVNQDGDPYLYQLYRRWGCSSMVPSRLSNATGGEFEARYAKEPASRWTFGVLSQGVDTVQAWLDVHSPGVEAMITLDIVVPSYRVQLALLDNILSLKPSATCSTMFIIIVDDPNSEAYHELMLKYGSHPHIRIRKHVHNLGASAARNRGLIESSADWVHFLDDDVIPHPELLIEGEKMIRKHPNAAGFVGDTRFPVADSIFKTAVHLANVTYFWGIATKQSGDLPWGVTANIIVRRNVTNEDTVRFDLRFPKTGGGEDIDFCILKDRLSHQNGGIGFQPAPGVVATHPWWNKGRRSYRRFYMWGKGDGALIHLHPDLTYYDFAPNSAETLILAALSLGAGVIVQLVRKDSMPLILAIKLSLSMFSAQVIYDTIHIVRTYGTADHDNAINTSLRGAPFILAAMESTLIRISSEVGRLVGVCERGELSSFGRRFDWFANKAGSGPRQTERKSNIFRALLATAMFAAMSYCA